MEYVMYVIVRESLNLSPGKLAAQVGHVVGVIYSEYISNLNHPNMFDSLDLFYKWELDGYRKVILKANDHQFERVKKEISCGGFSPFVTRDFGLTEIEPGTETCLGLWPIKKENTPKLIKRLRLY